MNQFKGHHGRPKGVLRVDYHSWPCLHIYCEGRGKVFWENSFTQKLMLLGHLAQKLNFLDLFFLDSLFSLSKAPLEILKYAACLVLKNSKGEPQVLFMEISSLPVSQLKNCL